MSPGWPRWGALLLLASLSVSPLWAADESSRKTSSSDCQPDERQQTMLELVNEARSQPRQCGNESFPAAEPLGWSCALGEAAQGHASNMASNDFFSHTSPDGAGIEQRVTEQGYQWRAVGENIAAGHRSADAAVAGWMESPGHCRNIMNATFTEMGMAKASNREARYTHYWAQSLGTPR